MPFEHRVRVQFFEVDLQGVVFNMWYLAWFDTAMSLFFAELGFPYDDTMRDGWDVQLVHTELDWSGSARFGDAVVVEVSTDRIGTTSFTLGYRVLRGDVVLVALQLDQQPRVLTHHLDDVAQRRRITHRAARERIGEVAEKPRPAEAAAADDHAVAARLGSHPYAVLGRPHVSVAEHRDAR